MKKHILQAFIVVWMVNALFTSYMVLEGSKYPLNLMSEQQAYNQLNKIKGVGEVKAKRIAESRKEIVSVKQLDTKTIKYSKYFTVRRCDMRTDVMYAMFGISLLIMLFGVAWFLVLLYRNGIKVIVNKYIVLDSPKEN